MAGVGERLREGGRVLLVVEGVARPQLPEHAVDVGVRVDDRYQAGTEHQDQKGGRVRDHVAPVQHAYVRVSVEVGPVAEQRGTAEHRRRDPGEGHPALAPGETSRVAYCYEGLRFF